jgi:hypothetical protein
MKSRIKRAFWLWRYCKQTCWEVKWLQKQGMWSSSTWWLASELDWKGVCKMLISMGTSWILGYLIFSQSDKFLSFFIVCGIVPNLCLDVTTWGCNPVGKWVITITQKCGTSTFGLSAYRVRSHFYIWDAGRERGPHGQQQRESWGGPGDDEGRRRFFTSP